MFKYSVCFLAVMCFTPIRAPDPVRTSVTHKQFNDWGCETICNEENQKRIDDWCVKLSGTQDPDVAQRIRNHSECKERQLQLISDSEKEPRFYDKTVGFCDMGQAQSEKKCITKSEGADDILVWDREGQGLDQYCTPKYEKVGWFAAGGEK